MRKTSYLFNPEVNDLLADKELVIDRLLSDWDLTDDTVVKWVEWYKSLPLSEQNIIYLRSLGLKSTKIGELFDVTPQCIRIIEKKLREKRKCLHF